jgi:uncharacterized protein
MRQFTPFALEGANFRISSTKTDIVVEELLKQRRILITYIRRHPEFMEALSPILPQKNPPEIVSRMINAANQIGVGPMATVAGINAEFAVRAAILQGTTETIVENGGDIYIQVDKPIVIGIYAKNSILSGKVAFYIQPEETPLAICSSSSQMGHSKSFGDCNLATVLARDAALADAAATHVCNQIKSVDDVHPTLETIMEVEGIQGGLVIKEDQIGLIGQLPELIKFNDPRFINKITADKNSNFNICH